MLSKNEQEQVEQIAELEVRRYFDRYLTEVFPKQIAAVVKAHDQAADAHGGIRGKFSKFKWILVGLAIGGGMGAGLGLKELIQFL